MASEQEEDEVGNQSGCYFVKLPGNLGKSIDFPGKQTTIPANIDMITKLHIKRSIKLNK